RQHQRAAAGPERGRVQALRGLAGAGRARDHGRAAGEGARAGRRFRGGDGMTTAEATAEAGGLAGAVRDWWTDVKSGQLGSLPIIVGLIIIAIVFQSQNDRFLTASNFVNLIV